jgi:ABC-type sugar transport system substrate-binding protein
MKFVHTLRRGPVAVAVVTAALLAVGACSSSPTKSAASVSGSVSGGGTYTPAAVAAASGAYQVKPIFAVPKTLPKKYSFAFLNNGKSNAFFATWSQGMNDAAKFYGVTFEDVDLNFHYENELSDYQQLAVKQPDVVGANVMNSAVYNQMQKDGTKLVMIDGSFQDAPHYGVPDEQVGQLAIKQLEAPAKTKIAGAWQGKKLVVVGMSAPNCAPCDARVKAAFGQAETDLGVASSDTFMLTPAGQDPTSASQSTFADFLTAHPGVAILVMSYGDEPVIGAVNAAKAAGRGGDILAITNGGDEAARAAVRDSSNAGILIGSIDYQPYAEGWNFIEAAIATAMGKPFSAFTVNRVLTPQNINTYYPNDKQ